MVDSWWLMVTWEWKIDVPTRSLVTMATWKNWRGPPLKIISSSELITYLGDGKMNRFSCPRISSEHALKLPQFFILQRCCFKLPFFAVLYMLWSKEIMTSSRLEPDHYSLVDWGWKLSRKNRWTIYSETFVQCIGAGISRLNHSFKISVKSHEKKATILGLNFPGEMAWTFEIIFWTHKFWISFLVIKWSYFYDIQKICSLLLMVSVLVVVFEMTIEMVEKL